MNARTFNNPTIPSDLKYTNRYHVINFFLNGGCYSASDAANAIGLSRFTVMKSIQFFVGQGLLVSAGKGDSTNQGGKRPELFMLSTAKYFLCVMLWPQELRLRLCTIGNQPVDELHLHIPLPSDAREALENVGRLSNHLLEKNHVDPASLCAVSVSTAGTIDYASGVLRYSSQSPEWGVNVPVREYLRPFFAPSCLLFFENAGKMTARPFLIEPEFEGKRVLVIFSCWGLSSCLIQNGHILSGRNSLIGEIGHMTIDQSDSEQCGCGSHGCLERLVSLERIVRMIRSNASDYPASHLNAMPDSEITIPLIFSLSEQADSLARYVTDYIASAFAVALRNISLVFDPDYVIFQGSCAMADAYFDECLWLHLQQFQYYPSKAPFVIRYDRRDVEEMDAFGSYIALTQAYFDSSVCSSEPDDLENA